MLSVSSNLHSPLDESRQLSCAVSELMGDARNDTVDAQLASNSESVAVAINASEVIFIFNVKLLLAMIYH